MGYGLGGTTHGVKGQAARERRGWVCHVLFVRCVEPTVAVVGVALVVVVIISIVLTHC